jgi:uncharacterized protein with HEPN domain
MRQNRDLAYVRHMLDYSRQAVDFLHNRRRSDMEKDAMLALAITRLIELIGEAARKVSPALTKRYPAIPWPLIIGTRDRLAHGYIEIDYDIIWKIVKSNLPPLIKELNKLLSDES